MVLQKLQGEHGLLSTEGQEEVIKKGLFGDNKRQGLALFSPFKTTLM